MTVKWTLTEQELKEAVECWLDNTHDVDVEAKKVVLLYKDFGFSAYVEAEVEEGFSTGPYR